MVFVKRDIPSSQTLVLWDTGEVPKDKILQVTNQVNMAGMMTQFTLLMSYSHELFAGLLDEANATFGRIRQLDARVQQLHKQLPSIEAKFEGDELTVLTRMTQTGAKRYTAANPEKHQHFQPTALPKSVAAVRAHLNPPPRLHLLDAFADDGKPCLTKYSNPNFFLEQWAAEQDKKFAELKAERKKKREERVARRAERGDGQQGGIKPVRKLKKIRYDPQTGERIVEEEDEPVVVVQQPRPVSQPSATTAAPAVAAPVAEPQTSPPVPEKKGKTKDKVKDKKPEKPPKPAKLTKDADVPAPTIPAPVAPPVDLPPTMIAPPPPMETANIPPPPPVGAPAPPPPPPIGAPVPPPMSSGQAEFAAPAPPPPPPVAAPAPPPPPPVGAPAPPPPPPAPAAGGSDTSDLMAQIRGGTSGLKKAETSGGAMEKPVDTRSNLLENIRNGLKLKSAQERRVPEVSPPSNAPSSVAEILARRIAIEPDSDDDVDDDDDDWSD